MQVEQQYIIAKDLSNLKQSHSKRNSEKKVFWGGGWSLACSQKPPAHRNAAPETQPGSSRLTDSDVIVDWYPETYIIISPEGDGNDLSVTKNEAFLIWER